MGTPSILVSNTQLQTSLVSHYQTPTGMVAIITAATFNNPASRSATFSVHIVAPGGSADASNQVITDLSVPADGDPVLVPALVAQVMPAGYSLQMVANVADAITPFISGDVREVS